MATRLDYRNRLKDKLLGLEDEGYGDFEFTDSEHNTFLEFSVANLFPALYKRVQDTGLSLTTYGTNRWGHVTPTAPERVYMVEDAAELMPIHGWKVSGSKIVGLDIDVYTTVNCHYTDAYVLPADDVTDAGIPARYTPLIVLGALIEALESRHDTGVRGDPGATGRHEETSLLDRLVGRYERLKEEMAMSLPGVTV